MAYQIVVNGQVFANFEISIEVDDNVSEDEVQEIIRQNPRAICDAAIMQVSGDREYGFSYDLHGIRKFIFIKDISEPHAFMSDDEIITVNKQRGK